MRKTLICFAFLVSAVTSNAQKNSALPRIGVKFAPTGLLVGDLGFQAEYNIGKSSLTAKIGIPVDAHHSFTYQGNDANFSMKASSFLAGYRTYLSKKHMKGLYLEPYFKYVHHTGEGLGKGTLAGNPVTMNFTNDYNGTGLGLQLGAQFLIGRHFLIDLFFLGPEINSATDHFKATEVSSTIPWTYIQANEAERNIRDFIDQFPFVKNKTTITVDQPNKSVMANFSGAVPGVRAGVSLGFAF